MNNIIKKSIAFVFAVLMCFSAFSVAENYAPLTAYAASAISIKKQPTLKASKVKSTSVKLSWSKVKKATSYKLYRSTNKKKWKLIKTTKKTSYTVNKLKSNKKYYFRVRAIGKNKKSPYSKTVTVKTKKAPTEDKDDGYIMKTDGGIKLYPITSAEAKEIASMHPVFYMYPSYEGKSANGKNIVVYTKNEDGWLGIDANAAHYNSFGVKKFCEYCGKIKGNGKNMCVGQCVMSFH